ncbi:MAG: hypothetical protein K2J79_02205 [Ruminiclostridium sp.]|nr:hypothetical protein [Ruminiclostridium sp.]
MKKSKAIIFILTAALLLSACSNADGEVKNSENANDPETSISEGAWGAVKPTDDTDAPAEITSPNPTKPVDPPSFGDTATIEETVIYNENNIKITATELTYSSSSVSIGLNIENNTAENLSFRCGTIGYSANSVNGYMVETGYVNCDVSAGKKAMDTVEFDLDALMLYGIDEIGEIELAFSIENENYDYIYTDPLKIKTSAFGSVDYEKNTFQTTINEESIKSQYGFSVDSFFDEKLFDKNGVKVISEALVTNKSGEQVLIIELENSSSKQLEISLGKISLNGLTVENGTKTINTVNPNKKCVVGITLSSLLDENYWDIFGLKEIGKIDLRLKTEENDKELDSEFISISLPGKDASFNNSGVEVYNKNGMKIIFKGFAKDHYSYNDDLHALFIAENTSGKEISINNEYNSMSINGYMVDYSYYGSDVSAGANSILDMRIDDDSLASNKINSEDDIEEFEVSLKLRDDGYNDIDNVKISIRRN